MVGAMRQWMGHNAARWLAMLAAAMLLGQIATPQGTDKHGRKYKAPLATARVVVTVIKGANGKPIHNAAVIFHSSKDAKDDGNLEMKTDVDGKASIDVIPLGSKVEIQVIADGYATFGEDYELGSDTTKEIIVKMNKPKSQYSTYTSNNEAGASKAGVQEPAHPATADAAAAPPNASAPAAGTASTPAPAAPAKQPK